MLSRSGIYQIRNTVNGKVYVGSAKLLRARRSLHLGELRRGTHHCVPLQRAWKKYGPDAFVFETLITCAPSMLLHYEQQFLDQWKPEYNVCRSAGSRLGAKHTAESIAKMRAVQKGRTFTLEALANMSAAQRTKISLTRYTANGTTHSLSEWAEITGVSVVGLYGRLRRGWSVEATMATPITDAPLLTYDGRTQAPTQWAREYGLGLNTLLERLKRGWSLEKALQIPIKHQPREFRGETKTLSEWADTYGLSVNSLKRRLRCGWSLERALTQPVEVQDHSKKAPRGVPPIEFKGERKSISKWAEELGIDVETLRRRLLNLGWSVDKAFTTPVRGAK